MTGVQTCALPICATSSSTTSAGHNVLASELARALDPERSCAVEACAGSGKTWLLVSRILRLLLAGAAPGSILALTYMAAQRTFPDYNEMAEAKAMLESYARSFGYHFGVKNHVRVNTVSQSPTMTTAGSGVKGFKEFFNYADKMAPLGNAPAEACADYCLTLFSDFTRFVTMQNLFHDGGFSNMGMNPAVFGL